MATDTAWGEGGGPGLTSFLARRLLRASRLFLVCETLGPPPRLSTCAPYPARPFVGLCAGAVPAGARWGAREAHAQCGARRRSRVAAPTASQPATVGRRS